MPRKAFFFNLAFACGGSSGYLYLY